MIVSQRVFTIYVIPNHSNPYQAALEAAGDFKFSEWTKGVLTNHDNMPSEFFFRPGACDMLYTLFDSLKIF